MIETLTSVQRTIQWLWYPYIPFGGITLIQGAPGTGKSFLLADLAAEASLEAQVADTMKGSPCVLLQCADDSNSVVRSRLQKNGACLDRVAFCEQMNKRAFSVGDMSRLHFAGGKKFTLIMIDPIEAFIDIHCDNQKTSVYMHDLIRDLSLQARLNDWALVLTTAHDSIHGNVIDRDLGRIEQFREIKSVLKLQKKGTSQEYHTILQARNEYAPCGSLLQFQIDERIGMHWIGLRPDFQRQMTTVYDGNSSTREAAVDWMKKELLNRELPAKEILHKLKGAGFSESTIIKAKEQSGILSVRKNRKWFWKI